MKQVNTYMILRNLKQKELLVTVLLEPKCKKKIWRNLIINLEQKQKKAK